MKRWIYVPVCLLMSLYAGAQWKQEDIYTPFVLYKERVKLDENLKENIIGKTFNLPLDSNTAYKYESACWAITQFLLRDKQIEAGFERMLKAYDMLDADARQAVLEAIYGNYPTRFKTEIDAISRVETDAKLFSICLVYLLRNDSSAKNRSELLIRMTERFPEYDSTMVLSALQSFLNNHSREIRTPIPALTELFSYSKSLGRKTVYSFQRWNRDYPGLAIVQNVDGRFVRHPDGRLMVFQQLARSGSDLPYFITNGSTPQGVYSISGIGISHNNLIGPTPNLQMAMPYEEKWEKYFQLDSTKTWDSTQNTLAAYLNLLPAGWRSYTPMTEAFTAGKVGRTEVIAHGTTIDPEYFRDQPFYPLTPTLGCLCAREQWNVTTGRPTLSEQLGLVNAFLSTHGSKGYLIVVNLDNQQRPVTREELDKWVQKFEQTR